MLDNFDTQWELIVNDKEKQLKSLTETFLNISVPHLIREDYNDDGNLESEGKKVIQKNETKIISQKWI